MTGAEVAVRVAVVEVGSRVGSGFGRARITVAKRPRRAVRSAICILNRWF